MNTTRRGLFKLIAGCAALPFVPLALKAVPKNMTATEVSKRQQALLDYYELRINPPVIVHPDGHFDIIKW